MIDSFSSVSLNPYATGPARLEVGAHQFGLLAGVVAASSTWLDWTSRRKGRAAKRLSVSMQSASLYMSRVFDYLLVSLRSLRVEVDRPTRVHIPVLSLRGQRRARRAGGASGWPTTASSRSPTSTRVCWMSSESTTLGVRSPSGWRTTRRLQRSINWCAPSRRLADLSADALISNAQKDFSRTPHRTPELRARPGLLDGELGADDRTHWPSAIIGQTLATPRRRSRSCRRGR